MYQTFADRARTCKCLRRPGIDFKESIPPAYLAWRAGASNRVVVPARQAENRFLGSLKGLQIRALDGAQDREFAANRSPSPTYRVYKKCFAIYLSLWGRGGGRRRDTACQTCEETLSMPAGITSHLFQQIPAKSLQNVLQSSANHSHSRSLSFLKRGKCHSIFTEEMFFISVTHLTCMYW